MFVCLQSFSVLYSSLLLLFLEVAAGHYVSVVADEPLHEALLVGGEGLHGGRVHLLHHSQLILHLYARNFLHTH